MTITIRTLGDIAGKERLFAECDRIGCGHSQELLVEDLERRFGKDFELAELRRRVRCSKCGARPPDVRVHAVSDGRAG